MDDKRQGKGRMVFGKKEPDHKYYEGDFQDNMYHGMGKFVWVSGTTYEGEFEHSKPEGQGRIEYASGLVYRGHWKTGEWDGLGKELYKEGGYRYGGYEHGQRDGNFLFVNPKGYTICEHWNQGTVTTVDDSKCKKLRDEH